MGYIGWNIYLPQLSKGINQILYIKPLHLVKDQAYIVCVVSIKKWNLFKLEYCADKSGRQTAYSIVALFFCLDASVQVL